jgi:hypothetical protein
MGKDLGFKEMASRDWVSMQIAECFITYVESKVIKITKIMHIAISPHLKVALSLII